MSTGLKIPTTIRMAHQVITQMTIAKSITKEETEKCNKPILTKVMMDK